MSSGSSVSFFIIIFNVIKSVIYEKKEEKNGTGRVNEAWLIGSLGRLKWIKHLNEELTFNINAYVCVLDPWS